MAWGPGSCTGVLHAQSNTAMNEWSSGILTAHQNYATGTGMTARTAVVARASADPAEVQKHGLYFLKKSSRACTVNFMSTARASWYASWKAT